MLIKKQTRFDSMQNLNRCYVCNASKGSKRSRCHWGKRGMWAEPAATQDSGVPSPTLLDID